jgi:hypothetical protein
MTPARVSGDVPYSMGSCSTSNHLITEILFGMYVEAIVARTRSFRLLYVYWNLT